MRGKIARKLRQLAEFNPGDSRTYQTWELMRKRNIMQYDSVEKKVNIVQRDVSCPLVECTDPKRILYKFMKKKYNNLNAEMEVVPLPTTEELNVITEQIKQELNNKEIVRADAGGGLPSTSSEDGGSNLESGGLDAESQISGG